MYLRGWKYEGRKIADKLHEQMLVIVEILNDPDQVGNKNGRTCRNIYLLSLELRLDR